ncbi:MAG: CNNM domain-containing protein [Salinivirgaceae bacterium]
MSLLILYLFIAIGISFVCSILEAVLLSTPDSYIELLIHEKRKKAPVLRDLKKHIDRPLAAILSINTIAHTVGAAGVGAQATRIFGEAYFGIISALLTLMILVLSEIIPKTIGARYWRQLIILTVPVIRIFMILAYPFVFMSEQITRVIAKGGNIYTFSRDEISSMASVGYREGVLGKDELMFIDNLLKMKNVVAEDVMTPRTVMVAISGQMTVAEFLSDIDEFHFSRIPVYYGFKENITGYVLKADLLEKAAKDELNVEVASMQREITKVYERVTLPRLFQLMMKKNDLIALVIDEYGGIEGVVTLEDIIETITGIEIVDEKDTHTDYQVLAREIWRTRHNTRNNLLDT